MGALERIMGTEYHKIQSIYKRHTEGQKKGQFKIGEWARPAIGYLAPCEWEWTEKVDGMNMRIEMRDMGDGALRYNVGGKTDRANIPGDLMEYIHGLGLRELLPEKFDGPVTLYGEGYGAGIQRGGGYRQDKAFVLFDIKVGEWWLEREAVESIAATLGLDVVPVLGRGTLHEAMAFVAAGFESRWGPGFEPEGLVCRPMVRLSMDDGKRIIVKIKGKDLRKAGLCD